MVQIRILTTEQAAEWQDVLDRCVQYDFYHLSVYHALAEEQGEGMARLFVWNQGEWTIALPLLLRSLDSLSCAQGIESDWKDATSVYGYAGPITSAKHVPEDVRAAFQAALRQALREWSVVSVFSRLHPLLAGQSALLTGMGECRSLAPTISLDLTISLEAQRAQFRRNHRDGIGRLRRKGITTFHDPNCTHLADFIDLYYETMRRVGAAQAYFYPESYFQGIHERLGARLHLFGSHIDGQFACGGLFVECNGILQFHLGGTRDAFLRLAPVKLLFDDVRLWACARGLRVLHLGGGATARPDDSLLHFKMGFSDLMHDFRVWRYKAIPAAYEQICQNINRWNERQGLRPTSADYFPAYRCPTVPIVHAPAEAVPV